MRRKHVQPAGQGSYVNSDSDASRQPTDPPRGDHRKPERQSATGIARSAALVIGLLAFAKLFSLVEKKIALDRFGITSAWDTFTVANQAPEQLFNLIAGGALAYAFIPIFGDFLTRDDTDGAWRLASNVLNSIFLAVALMAIVTFAAAPWLVAHVLA